MDPLADKALVMTAFIIMVKLGYCDIVCFSLMLAREFLVSGVRMIAASKAKLLPHKFGKAKTFLPDVIYRESFSFLLHLMKLQEILSK